MYKHIILDSTYADDFISFVCSNYNKNDHLFYIMPTVGRECVNTNINQDRIIKINNRKILSVLMSAGGNDELVIHGLFNNHVICFLYFYRKLLKRRCSIVMWGADLYEHRNLSNEKFPHKAFFLEIFRKYIFQNVKQLAFDMPTDYTLMQEWYGTQRDVLYITYPQLIDRDTIKRAREQKEINNKRSTINILIGNSATDTNRHVEIFEWIKKYKDEDVKIFCPLSYGDVTYAKKIADIGEKTFGDKFVPLLDFLDTKKYINLMSNIDVAIFHNNRQQAMGNITLASCLGSKVYISQQTSMWRQYVEAGGCHFYKTEDIPNMDFEDFIDNKDKDINANKEYFEEVLNESNMKKIWNPILIQRH